MQQGAAALNTEEQTLNTNYEYKLKNTKYTQKINTTHKYSTSTKPVKNIKYKCETD